MTLPQPWIPDPQDDELAGMTESDIERRIRTLKSQLPQAQQHMQADFGQIAGDEQRIELARRIVHNLDDAGSAVPTQLRAEADAFVQQETARATADLQKTVDESDHVKWLSDEIRYGEAWVNACNHLRGFQQSTLQHLTDALDKLTATAGQLMLPAQGVVILTLPDGVQEFDLHLWQQKTVEVGKRISRETKDLTVKLLAAPNRAEEKSNVVLRTTFKIAQFLYYVISLARAAGDILTQQIHDFHHVLEKFLALLPAAVRLAA